MNLIHVAGPQCSGKTHLIRNVLGVPPDLHWDVLDYYDRMGAWDGSRVDSRRCPDAGALMDLLDLLEWLEARPAAAVLFVETSGVNRGINRWLWNDAPPHLEVCLLPPDGPELVERAHARGLAPDKVRSFNRHWAAGRAGTGRIQLMDQTEAYRAIREVLPAECLETYHVEGP